MRKQNSDIKRNIGNWGNLMPESHFLAGIFFADDDVIWATASVTDRRYAYPGIIFETSPDFANKPIERKLPRARRFASKATAQLDVSEAVAKIAKAVDITKIEAVTTASIGPFEGGQSGLVEGGKIIPGARLLKWAGFDLAGSIAEEFRKHGNTNVIVRCLVDAEALVLGEHYHYRRFKLSGFAYDSEKYRKEARSLGQDTVAYLLLDSGVGGAVFQRNFFKRGEASLELGHMLVRAPPGLEAKYPAADCGAHYLPCLEGSISLPALEEFWGLSLPELQTLDANSEELSWLGFYVAQAVHHMTLFFTPTVVLLGGRIASNPAILTHTIYWYKRIMQNPRGERLYPDYAAQHREEEYIKLWSRPDAGVLGCLCWSFRSVKAGQGNNGNLAQVTW